ncbi:MAG: hypothetical protein IJ105_00525, partial [Bacilli bacterium]|nr:hypothetical protein [Bacilli bacterium]
DSNDTKRGLLYFQPGDETVRLDARNSAGTAGQGKLNLLGNPVMVNGKEIGEFAGVNPDAVNLANATDKSVGSITLSAGTWFVYFNVRFATNATGRRYAALFTDSSCSSGTGILGSNAVNAVNGGQTFVNAQQILNHSASRTYYVCAYQNSGSTLSTTARIQAIRIDY